MQRLFGLALAATTLLSAPAFSAPEHARLRGTITAINGDTLTLRTPTGDIPVMLGSATKYLEVEKSSLGNIGDGSYIGTATKADGPNLVALEVVVFPPSMKGAGEGHYAWDALPDTTKPGATMTGSTMTNGTVAAPAVGSTMTNGNVSASSAHDGSKQLTVTYKGGKQVILVPPTAPVVTFKPGTMSDAVKGSAAFVSVTKDEGKVMANMVAIGANGVTPPM